MAVPVQRTGAKSRIVWFKEVTFDSDASITAGIVVPLNAVDSFNVTQARTDVPKYDATRQAAATVLAQISAAGNLPIDMDFTFIGNPLVTFCGSDGYSHASGSALHQFYGGGTPGSCQIQKEFTETTAQYLRDRGVRTSTMGFTYQTSGPSVYTLGLMGLGDELQTALAGSPTIANPCFTPVSYFNGYISIGGTNLAIVTALTITLDNQLSSQPVAFNAGIAGAINAGLAKISGSITLLFNTTDNWTWLNDAINDTELSMECVWTDQGGNALVTATEYIRLILPDLRLSRPGTPVGGNNGIVQQFNFTASYDCSVTTTARAGQIISSINPITAPITITSGSNDALKVTVDGGSPVTVTVAAGTYSTVADLVAAIPSITGATVGSFLGWLTITSNSTGAASSILVDGVVTHHADVALGLDTTAHTGFANNSFFIDLFGPQTTAY